MVMFLRLNNSCGCGMMEQMAAFDRQAGFLLFKIG